MQEIKKMIRKYKRLLNLEPTPTNFAKLDEIELQLKIAGYKLN